MPPADWSARNSATTRIDALDKLLGEAIPLGSIVLVKGPPATGKTTLCARIMVNAAKDNKPSKYLATDELPDVALRNVGRVFRDLSDEQFDLISKVPIISSLPLSSSLSNIQGETLSAIAGRFWAQVSATNPAIIVIDSITGLIDAYLNLFSGIRQFSERRVLTSFLRAFSDPVFRGSLSNSLLYLVAEDSVSGEYGIEYRSDVTIKLECEVRGRTPDAPVDQPRLYCTVTKGRGLSNQHRRCCYDLTDDGITFYPTFAAEGHVSLFWENASQYVAINDFTTIDSPILYPSVNVSSFTRSGLQNIFSVHRRSRDIPKRTSLLLSNVDEYWIRVLAYPHGPGGSTPPLLVPINASKLKLYQQGENQYNFIKELEQKQLFRDNRDSLWAVPQSANVGMFVYRSDVLDDLGVKPPTTWGDVERICSSLQDKGRGELLLETQTYDSFMVTMMELFWNHGAVFRVLQKPTGDGWDVEWLLGGMDEATRAMKRLNRWVCDLNIVSPDSTVQPHRHLTDNWVFARHWYSTLIDVLFCCDGPNGDLQKRASSQVDLSRLRVCPIPVSRSYKKAAKRVTSIAGISSTGHHSAWGEWYLAVHAGSENLELGIDIIESLMTSRKIVDRALSGGGLPTIEKFYERYGSAECPGTAKTFSAVREMFFANALSRTLLENYPRVSRILYGACWAILRSPKMTTKQIKELLTSAFDEIQSANE